MQPTQKALVHTTPPFSSVVLHAKCSTLSYSSQPHAVQSITPGISRDSKQSAITWIPFYRSKPWSFQHALSEEIFAATFGALPSLLRSSLPQIPLLSSIPVLVRSRWCTWRFTGGRTWQFCSISGRWRHGHGTPFPSWSCSCSPRFMSGWPARDRHWSRNRRRSLLLPWRMAIIGRRLLLTLSELLRRALARRRSIRSFLVWTLGWDTCLCLRRWASTVASSLLLWLALLLAIFCSAATAPAAIALVEQCKVASSLGNTSIAFGFLCYYLVTQSVHKSSRRLSHDQGSCVPMASCELKIMEHLLNRFVCLIYYFLLLSVTSSSCVNCVMRFEHCLGSSGSNHTSEALICVWFLVIEAPWSWLLSKDASILWLSLIFSAFRAGGFDFVADSSNLFKS